LQSRFGPPIDDPAPTTTPAVGWADHDRLTPPRVLHDSEFSHRHLSPPHSQQIHDRSVHHDERGSFSHTREHITSAREYNREELYSELRGDHGSGLEGRLTSHYDRRYNGESFHPESIPFRNLDRERDHGHEDRSYDTYDERDHYSNSEQLYPSRSPPPSHFERSRYADIPPTEHAPLSRPRRRRSIDDHLETLERLPPRDRGRDIDRPRSPMTNGAERDAYSHRRERPPNDRRGGTLLDRLSLEDGDVTESVSSREIRGDDRYSNGDGRNPANLVYDDRDGGAEGGPRGYKGSRRRGGGRPRRTGKRGVQ
jgi:hypothetical protein